MKRSQQESSDSDSSSFLFAAEPNDSESDAPKSLFSKDAEEKPVKPTKRARKSPKPTPHSEPDSPKNESPSLVLEPLQEAKEDASARLSDSEKPDKRGEEPRLRETAEENTITSERPKIDVPPQVEANKETPEPSTKTKPVKPEESSQESSVAPSESKPSAYQVVARRYRPRLGVDARQHVPVAELRDNRLPIRPKPHIKYRVFFSRRDAEAQRTRLIAFAAGSFGVLETRRFFS